MTKISSYILIMAAWLLSLTVNAQEDARYNKLIQEFTLNEDGSSSYREYKEVKLLTHMAFHRLFGETFIIYDPENQGLKITEAYTIMHDGKRVDVPGNAFNEVLPRNAAHAAPYNSLREMVVTHTGLEVGATIFLDYTVTSKAGYYPAFMGEVSIKDMVPVKEKQVIINIPAGEELHYKMLNLRTAPEITSGDKFKTYIFTFREVKPYYQAWGVDTEALPRLFFSTAKDFARAYFPFVAQDAFTFRISSAMAEKAGEIKGENEGDLKTALAMQKMVVDETGTWNLDPAYIGYKCRTPEEVWASNAGTPIEKTVLLASLLRGAGLEAVPVAIFPGKYYDEKIGSLDIFKDYAVRVKTDGSYIYLSAKHMQSQDMAAGMNGQKAIVLDGAVESVRAFDLESHPEEIIYKVEAVLDDSLKLKASADILLTNGANPYFRLYGDTAYAKRYFPGAKNAELKSMHKDKTHFVLDIEKKDAAKAYGNYCFLDLPSIPGGTNSWGYNYMEKGRQEALSLPGSVSEKYNYMITVPDGYKLISPEVQISAKNEVGMVKISCFQDGNTISIAREITIEQDHVAFSEFGAFNELWEAWMNPSLKTLVFKK